MVNFYFLLLFILFSSIVTYRRQLLYCYRSKHDNLFLFISMGLLLLLNCLRGESVGNDTIAYKKLFDYYSGSELISGITDAGSRWMNEYVDVGYRKINILFAKVSRNYQLFISLIAVFLYGSVIKFLKNESENLCISVLLFFLIFYHPYLNVLRQAIAISIILLGFPLLKGRKYIKFSLCIILAILFHKTAVVVFILIPLMELKKYSFVRAVFIIILVFGLTVTNVFRRIVSLFGYTGLYLNEEEGISTYAGILLSMIVFLCINYLRGRHVNKNNGNAIDSSLERFYIRIPVIHLCLSIACLDLPILYRCSYYFTIFYITAVPYFLMRSKKTENDKMIVLFAFIFTFVVYQTGILCFRPEWYTEFQYQFFWQ